MAVILPFPVVCSGPPKRRHAGRLVRAARGRAIDFWTRALGYAVSRGRAGGRWTELMPATGAGPGLALQLSETPAQEHPRIHLDLSVADAAKPAAGADRRGR